MRLKPIALRVKAWHLALAALPMMAIAGTSGVLHVYGSLQESPCWLKMDATASEATPHEHQLTLQLEDCPYSARDSDFWQQHAPSVRLAFFSPAHGDSPELIRVSGNDDIALRLLDEQWQPLPAQFSGMRVPLTPDHNTLHWHTVQEPVSPSAGEKNWSSVGRLRVSYD